MLTHKCFSLLLITINKHLNILLYVKLIKTRYSTVQCIYMKQTSKFIQTRVVIPLPDRQSIIQILNTSRGSYIKEWQMFSFLLSWHNFQIWRQTITKIQDFQIQSKIQFVFNQFSWNNFHVKNTTKEKKKQFLAWYNQRYNSYSTTFFSGLLKQLPGLKTK